jgi:hypothetical protein
MLKHGRAGVPMEVMGLMLGEFIDDTTVSATVPGGASDSHTNRFLIFPNARFQ